MVKKVENKAPTKISNIVAMKVSLLWYVKGFHSMLFTKQISFIFLTIEGLFRSDFYSKEIRYILFLFDNPSR